MISFSIMDMWKFKSYIDSAIRKNTSTAIIGDETEIQDIYKHFEMDIDDKFYVLKFNGKREEFEQELKLLNVPEGGFKKLFIMKAGSILDVEALIAIREPFFSGATDYGFTERKNAEMAAAELIVFPTENEEIEIIYAKKIFLGADLNKSNVFSSLWKEILRHVEHENDKPFFEKAKNVMPEICDKEIRISLPGETRVRFLLSVKHREIERLIKECTGEDYTIRVFD